MGAYLSKEANFAVVGCGEAGKAAGWFHGYQLVAGGVEGARLSDVVAPFLLSEEGRATPAGAACQRAALLFALAHEAELAAHYGPYARDLAERVLPFVTPRFVANSCQRPDAFVQLCVVLAELWEGEPLGNWPRAQAAAHHNVPGGRVADA